MDRDKFPIKTIWVVILYVVLASCGDYDKGYEDGYDGEEEKWVIIGKDEYLSGYEDGSFDADCDYWREYNYREFLRNCKGYPY